VSTEGYRVAREYMTRLEPRDLEAPRIEPLSALTALTPAAFRERFGRLFELSPR